MRKQPTARTRRMSTYLLVLALVALGTSCAADDPLLEEQSPAGSDGTAMDMSEEDHAEEDHAEEGHSDMPFAFGEPAEAGEADRVIEISARDDFSFDPADVTVSVGETVTFVVTNDGVIPHDFTLGDEHTQEEHEAEMAEMAEMGGDMTHEEPNLFSMAPGETKEMTWHFTEAGDVLIGCHQTGHYAAGMKGVVHVEA